MKYVVRYFGEQHDPEVFRGKGLRSFWILLLARVVAWLERKINWHVMLFIAKQQKFDKPLVSSFKESFKLNDGRHLEPEASRYGQRKTYAPEKKKLSYREARAVQNSNFFAGYVQGGRAMPFMYARNRRFANPDGDIVNEPGQKA